VKSANRSSNRPRSSSSSSNRPIRAPLPRNLRKSALTPQRSSSASRLRRLNLKNQAPLLPLRRNIGFVARPAKHRSSSSNRPYPLPPNIRMYG
jgi:hypothetical protein